MPELPEVETYVRELTPELAGRQVLGAQVNWTRTIASPDAEHFPGLIAGQRFASFGRRGKYMLLGMESGLTLIVHLRMTGHLRVEGDGAVIDQHTHVLMPLDDGRLLLFQDSRKFGRIWLVRDVHDVLARLGPEPLEDSFTVAGFGDRLTGRAASIKTLLLDQSIVAGVGNIYADEALFRAGILPARAAGTLDNDEVAVLHAAIRAVLTDGIAKAGSSLGKSGLQNYVRPGGEPGGFQEEFKVFRRTGLPCPVCGTPVERIVLGQRSTHFCPVCQR